MHPTSGLARTWRRQDKEGYWRRRWWVGSKPDRKQHEQLEHRWVWEEAHGEKLPAGYVVHHLDGDRAHNVAENLEALPRAQHEYEVHGRPNRQRIVGGVEEKQCSRCEQWWPREHYYKYGSHANVYCRACCAAYLLERRRAEGVRPRATTAYGCQCVNPVKDRWGVCVACRAVYMRAYKAKRKAARLE